MVKRKYEKFHDSKGLQEVSRALRAKVVADKILESKLSFTGVSDQHGDPGQEPSAQLAVSHNPRAKLRAEPQSQRQLQGRNTAAGSKQLQDTFKAKAQRLSQTTEPDNFKTIERSRLDSRCALAASELVQCNLKPRRVSFALQQGYAIDAVQVTTLVLFCWIRTAGMLPDLWGAMDYLGSNLSHFIISNPPTPHPTKAGACVAGEITGSPSCSV